MSDIIPIITPEVILQDYPSTISTALGRSITKSLDSKGLKLEGILNFIAMLGEITQPGANPLEVIRNPGALLKHLNYVFMVYCSTETRIKLLEQGSLNITSGLCPNGNYVLIVSGTLDQWRTAIIDSTSEASPFELRYVMDKALLTFERLGLGKLWVDYNKQFLKDKTFRLTHVQD